MTLPKKKAIREGELLLARLGMVRVCDVLDYERDIKGKGLVRLRAGVGAGKNYWVRHIPENYPNLQILMITSRKNTAAAEAYRLGTDNKIHTSELINIQDKDWIEGYSGSLTVCTNAYIEYFFKKIYDAKNPQTHLWNKFDVIFVDEAHSLTADAAFADSPFYVGRFIHHTRQFNPSCDIVLMTGTQEPTDWFFDDVFLPSEYTTIDLYNTCIHLVPDRVFLMNKASVCNAMLSLYQRGKRQIYFVNSVGRMAELIESLISLNVPEAVIGIAYTESENAQKLPEKLVKNKEILRKSIVENSRIPEETKIFITTTQNKEGISIEDDDIKYMFSESHQKSELEQMAGRVRGNPDTGTGLSALIVVYDATQHSTLSNYVEKEFDRLLVNNVKGVLDSHKQLLEDIDKDYLLKNDIATIHKHHRYIRYDYIGQKFLFYDAREQQDMLAKSDAAVLSSYVTLYDEPLGQYIDASSGTMYVITGRSELTREWFPYSIVYLSPNKQGLLEEALLNEVATVFRSQLEENNLVGIRLDDAKKQTVYEIVYQLIDRYGMSLLGCKKRRPKNLGPLFERLKLRWEIADHHSNDKLICVLAPMQKAADCDSA